jgi:hypothetical protein
MATYSFPQCMFIIFIFQVLSSTGLATGVQYCKKKIDTKVSICLGLATWENTTTSQTDIYFTFTSQSSPSGEGWAAIGAGDVMDKSLMFVMYNIMEKKGRYYPLLGRVASHH